MKLEIRNQKIADRLNNETSKGYVYILQTKNQDSWIKVGRTRDFKKRLGQYKTHYPFSECEYLAVFETDLMNRTETLCILEFIKRGKERKRREWFKIDRQEAVQCLKNCLDKKFTVEHACLQREDHK